MEEFDSCFKQLRQSVKEGVRDHSLAAALAKWVENIKLNPELVQPYSNALLRLYDLSNSSFFIARPLPSQSNQTLILDPLALAIKSIVLRMLACLVTFFNDNPNLELPSQMLFEALEIMVMLSRVLLDLGRSSEVRQIYALVMTFREAVGDVLSKEAELAHWLNIVQMFELDVDSRKLDVSQCQKALQSIHFLCSKAQPPQGYLDLVHHLTLMVILKLLKKGLNAESKSLVHFLPEKMKGTVMQLTAIETKGFNDDQCGVKLSPFYELYLQIKNTGIENIVEQNLRMFLGKEQYFNDVRLFDVVALTREVLPLQIWFQIHLNVKAKSQQVQAAYKCFLYLVDQTLEQTESKTGALVDQCIEKGVALSRLLKVSRVVMISLLGEKKDSSEPILNIIKRLSKLLIHLVLSLHCPPSQIQQYSQQLLLLCAKHNLNDMSRSITCIVFFYELIMGVVSQESYAKFYKTNLMDKGSELFRILKLAYQFRTSQNVDPDLQKELLKKQPYIMLLFATDPQEQLVLRIAPPEFAKMKEKWEIYLLLMSGEDSLNEGKLTKVLLHLEETLIYSDWSELSALDLSYLSDLTGYFLSALKEETQLLSSSVKVQLSLILLYLVTITSTSSNRTTLNQPILLNRYSKLLKLLSISQDQLTKLGLQEKESLIEHQTFLSKNYLCHLLQTMKIAYLQGQVALQAGQMLFIDLLKDLILKHEESQQVSDFFKFVRFELLSLCDSLSDSEIAYQSNSKLLKLYCSSKYIKKQMKLKIMRKLIKEDLISDSKMLTLSDLSELIQLAESPQQKSIFASYIIRSFGEEGKKYIILQSTKDPQGYSFLYDDHMEEDEQ